MSSDSIQYKPKQAQAASVSSVQGIGRGVINKAAWDKAYSAWCKRRGLRELFESDYAYGRRVGRNKRGSEGGDAE
jgi:hypothetical protein